MTPKSLVPGSRRAWTLIIIIAALAPFVRLFDTPVPFFSYHVLDDHPDDLDHHRTRDLDPRHVAHGDALDDHLGVGSWRPPPPGTGGEILELQVTLRDPIGDRTVFDAIGGDAILSN